MKRFVSEPACQRLVSFTNHFVGQSQCREDVNLSGGNEHGRRNLSYEENLERNNMIC